jgi:hypothetical protein
MPQTTQEIADISSSGTQSIPKGAYAVSMYNAGSTTAYLNGGVCLPGRTRTLPYLPGREYAALTYDRNGNTVYICIIKEVS